MWTQQSFISFVNTCYMLQSCRLKRVVCVDENSKVDDGRTYVNINIVCHNELHKNSLNSWFFKFRQRHPFFYFIFQILMYLASADCSSWYRLKGTSRKTFHVIVCFLKLSIWRVLWSCSPLVRSLVNNLLSYSFFVPMCFIIPSSAFSLFKRIPLPFGAVRNTGSEEHRYYSKLQKGNRR